MEIANINNVVTNVLTWCSEGMLSLRVVVTMLSMLIGIIPEKEEHINNS
jgi:hypothetical protein